MPSTLGVERVYTRYEEAARLGKESEARRKGRKRKRGRETQLLSKVSKLHGAS